MRTISIKRLVLVLASPLALMCWPGVASAELLAPPVHQLSAAGALGDVSGAVGKIDQVLPGAPAPVKEIRETVGQAVADPVGMIDGGEATAIPKNVIDSAERIVNGQSTPSSGPVAASSGTSATSTSSKSGKASGEKNATVAQRSRKAKPRDEKDHDDTRSIAAAGKRVHGTKVLGDSIFAFPRGDRGIVRTETSALPFTGGEIVSALLLGAALVAAGCLLLTWARWRPALCRAALTFSIL